MARPGAYVSWMRYFGRSQAFADALGIDAVYVRYLPERRYHLLPVKWPLQFAVTLWRLARLRPRAVLAMSPPVLVTTAAHLYGLVTGAPFVVDCHSAVFESRRWRWLLPVHAWYGRRAAAVLVTNPVHERIARSWGARVLRVADPPLAVPGGRDLGGERGGFVLAVNTFGPDELVHVLLDAARRAPEITFRVSGDTALARPEWLAAAPPNLHFTGFLSVEDFWGCARSADALVVLTDLENTILRGGWEAVELGQALVISSTEAMRRYFTAGAVFVEPTGASLAEGVRRAVEQRDDLRAAMRSFRAAVHDRWNRDRAELEAAIGFGFPAPQGVPASPEPPVAGPERHP